MYLFDTTYILPFFQIDVDLPNLKAEIEKILKGDLERYIPSICLIEAKWKTIREYQKTKNKTFIDRANVVIQSFIYSKYFEIIDPFKSIEVLNYADEVLVQGHKDYMDCLILATAKFHGFTLVSEDRKFPKIVDTLKWELTIKRWSEFYKEINYEGQ